MFEYAVLMFIISSMIKHDDNNHTLNNDDKKMGKCRRKTNQK